jgi:predicted kinase
MSKSILHLICGLPGSGKTTLAIKLEQQLPALRLSPDVWMTRLSADGHDAKMRAIIEGLQWDVAARALALGVDVILEFGFWSKRERENFRRRATALGAQTRIHYLDVSRDELVRRISIRNKAVPSDSFFIDIHDLDSWISAFEPPTEDECG